MRTRALFIVVAAGSMGLAACESPSPGKTTLPAGPQVVDVGMTEYKFVYDRRIAAGRVLLRVRNRGDVAHNMSVTPLPDDVPPIDEQLRGIQRRAIIPLARVTRRGPGTSTTIALDLEPGVRYAFICFVQDAEGRPHYLRGMSSEFRTPGAPARGRSSPASPTSSTTTSPTSSSTQPA